MVGCTSIKLNLSAWESEARGIPFENQTSEEIHSRELSPLLQPRAVGYKRFAQILRSKDVIKLTSWRHPRDG